MATKTATKTNRNAKAASKTTTTKATKKNATVAKPAAEEPIPADKKMSQIEAAVVVLAKAKEPMNCKAMVEAMQVEYTQLVPSNVLRHHIPGKKRR